VIANGLSSASLTKTGTGTLILSNADTYNGGTTVNAGTLMLGSGGSLASAGALTVSGGTFDLAGNNQTVSALSDGGASTGTITASTGASTLTINNTTPGTFSGTITDNNAVNGASLALYIEGSSSVTLSGSNNFTGGTTLTSGTLIAANDYALGNATSQNPSAGLTLSPSSSGTATVDFTSANPTIANLASGASGTSLIVLGTTLGSGSATTLNVGGADGAGTFYGTISDLSASKSTAIGNLNVYGGAYLVLAGTNTFTGTTTISGAGSGLIVYSALALEDSTLNYNNSQGGFLQFGSSYYSINLQSATLAGLTGAEGLALTNNEGNAVTLTIGNNNVSSSYSGNLSGLGSLTKIGTGTLTLSGNNSYTGTGGTTVSAGTLTLSGSNSTTGQAKVSSGATLQLQANAGNTVSGTSYALSVGANNLTMSGVNQSTSTLQLRSDSSVTFNGGNNLGGLGGTGSGETVDIDVNNLGTNGDMAANQTLTFAPGGFQVLNTGFNVTGGNGYTLALGQVTAVSGAQTDYFNPTTASLTINGFTASASGAMTMYVEGTSTGGNSVGGVISNGSGTVSVTKTGAGTWTLSAADTYTGATTVTGGTLIVSGSLSGSASASVTSGGTLELDGSFNKSATTTLNGPGILQGTGVVGAITANGGTLDPGLTGANAAITSGTLTAAGAVTLSSTTNFNIRVGVAGTTDSDQLAVTGGAAVTLNGTLNIALGAGLGALSPSNNPQDLYYVILNGGTSTLSGGFSSYTIGGNAASVTSLGAGISQLSAGGYIFDISYDGTSSALSGGDDVTLELINVPEPGTWAMMLAGMGMLGVWQRSRRNRRHDA
jgi:autotransporter-associated beta strand protein